MCCVFTIWNLKSAIIYKSGRVVLSRISVYFAINKLILLFSYYFHVPCLMLYKVCFYIARSMFSLVLNRSQSKASVQMSTLYLKLKYVFCCFQCFKNSHIHNVAKNSFIIRFPRVIEDVRFIQQTKVSTTSKKRTRATVEFSIFKFLKH